MRAYFYPILCYLNIDKKMLWMNIIPTIVFIPWCTSDIPYLLRSYPPESRVVAAYTFSNGPCSTLLKTLSFLKGEDEASFEKSECTYDSSELLLICKLSIKNASETLDLSKYPLDEIKVFILFVQEFPEKTFRSLKTRVLDLCFLNRFGNALQELAICSYVPAVTKKEQSRYQHILDVPALAIFESKIQTLLLSGIHLWQSVELRQFTSLKHLLIVQSESYQMNYYHSPFCADCIRAHPVSTASFHYLIPLSSQLTYFLFDNAYPYGPCQYDLLKKIRANPGTISTFVVGSSTFLEDQNKDICNTCASGLCPLLSVCLDGNSQEPRRKKDLPFECLCVEDVRVKDEFQSCEPMTIHQPIYSTRCNYTPSFWNYVTLSMIILASYILSSIIVFIGATIFLLKSK